MRDPASASRSPRRRCARIATAIQNRGCCSRVAAKSNRPMSCAVSLTSFSCAAVSLTAPMASLPLPSAEPVAVPCAILDSVSTFRPGRARRHVDLLRHRAVLGRVHRDAAGALKQRRFGGAPAGQAGQDAAAGLVPLGELARRAGEVAFVHLAQQRRGFQVADAAVVGERHQRIELALRRARP